MTISKEPLILCATQAGTIPHPSWPRYDSALTGSCNPSTARRSTLAVVKAMSTTWPMAKTVPPHRCRRSLGSCTAAGCLQSASYRCRCTGYAELKGAHSASRICCVWLHNCEVLEMLIWPAILRKPIRSGGDIVNSWKLPPTKIRHLCYTRKPQVRLWTRLPRRSLPPPLFFF